MERAIAIPEGLWSANLESLFPADGREGFLAGLARPCRGRNGLRYVVEEIVPLDERDFDHQSAGGLGLSPEASSFLNHLGRKAAKYGLAPVHIHSHPPGVSSFSAYDDQVEAEHHQWFRAEGQPVLISVVQARGHTPNSRIWVNGSPEPCLTRLGLQVFGLHRGLEPTPALDRQKAFGPQLALAASHLWVAIVGLGGVGLLTAELLARSGFSNFVLVDPDLVEASNLNRLPSLTARHLGLQKVKVAKAAIRRACHSLGREARVTAYPADIYQGPKQVKNAVGSCDLILALTDDHLSRITCLDLAFKHGAEYLQAGMLIGRDENTKIDSLSMEVTGAEIGRYCPLCSGRLDPGQASVDARRYVGGEVWARAQAEGYIPEEPAPAVMSLNAMVAGSLVMEIQSRMAGLGRIDLWQHDRLTGKLLFEKNLEGRLAGPGCEVCGRRGA